MQLTLGQQIQILKNTKLSVKLLSNGTFYFGDPWEFGKNETILYPFTGVVLNNSNISTKTVTTSFKIFFCDLVNVEEDNESYVLSDMQLSAFDYYSLLKYNIEKNYPATVSLTSTLSDFTERFDDKVSGWEMDITIEQFFDRSACENLN